MTQSTLRELSRRLPGRVAFDEPLAGYTTYRIGGPATALVAPQSVEDVSATLAFASQEGARWLALGLGSNVLIPDHGFDGVVIRLGKGLDGLTRGHAGDPRRWMIGAGLPTPRLARETANAGLSGVHRLVGVPGTVGGGVFMNAGAHGQDFAHVVRGVTVVDALGTVEHRPAAEIPWRYRSSGIANAVVVEAELLLEPADPRDLAEDIRQHFEWRKAGTPFNEPCCGSVFRNPGAGGAERAAALGSASRTAGQLIDAAGLKGFRIGGAAVSEKHANYIVNVGRATAADVLNVIDHVRKQVEREFGVELELEVQVVE